MTLPSAFTLGESKAYGDLLHGWIGGVSDGGKPADPGNPQNRMAAMVGKLTLALTHTVPQSGQCDCYPDPIGGGRNVLHFEAGKSQDTKWYCVVIVDDPVRPGNDITFQVYESEVADGTRRPKRLTGTPPAAELSETTDYLDFAKRMAAL